MLPFGVNSVLQYLDELGASPFAEWFEGLDAQAAAKVTTALYRMEQGNLSNAKGVRGGIFEFKINFGPGYRVYFGKDGEGIIILLGGGSKKRQGVGIAAALARWQDYKRRKCQERTPWH